MLEITALLFKRTRARTMQKPTKDRAITDLSETIVVHAYTLIGFSQSSVTNAIKCISLEKNSEAGA